MNSEPIDRVLSALGNYKAAGKRKWKAPCPAHEDRNPSLSIFLDDAGAVGLKCHAGCTTQDVLAALRLEKRDLFPRDDMPTYKPKPKASTKPKKAYADLDEAIRAIGFGIAQRKPGATLAAKWGYTNAAGQTIAYVVRWNYDDDGKEFRPFIRRKDGGRRVHDRGVAAARRVPWHRDSPARCCVPRACRTWRFRHRSTSAVLTGRRPPRAARPRR